LELIDLHTHGLAGLDTRSKVPDDYLSLALVMSEKGTGAFLPTLYPMPTSEMRAVMKAVAFAMEAQGKGAGGARILGVNLEGPFVNPARAGALGKDDFTPPDLEAFIRLVDGFAGVIKVMTVAPELPGALRLIEKAVAMGIRVNMGHSDATFEQARDGRLAGATGVTHLFNAMSGLHHRAPGLAGYALSDDSLYVEVIADLAHLHPATLRIALKCKPPGRILLVSDSLGPAKTPGVPEMGPLYMDDGVTLAGSGSVLADCVQNLVSLGVPFDTAMAAASVNPLRYLGGSRRLQPLENT